ncbi:MAG: GatB/YqeY domain-containing protein [Acidobacteria bacterium]|nr:GatB/YqeY domain-containing protein [Acidobacteriota bacterium]
MALLDQIQKDMVLAMKARDEARLSALRMIKTALKKFEIDCQGNRPELAEKEEAELKVVESYLPSAPTEEEIDAAIAAAMTETGITALRQMGVVMKAAQAKLAGKRVDGKALSERVRSKLS